MTKIINLTPHMISYFSNTGAGQSFPPSGTVARVSTIEESLPDIDGIETIQQGYGPVIGLPEPQPDTYYIVSALVRVAVPDRADILVPAHHVRNEQGLVIGCRAFIRNIPE